MKISSTRNIIVEIPCAMNRESLRCNGERYNLGVLPRGKKIIYIYIYIANVRLAEYFSSEFMHVIINCRLPNVQVEVPSLGSGE